MTILLFSASVFLISCFTGVFGVLTGLGGGMLLIPILTLMGVDLYHAMGASLISIITTSMSAASTPSGRCFTNFNMGIFLETGAVLGAFVGAFLLVYLPIYIIAITFSVVLLLSAYSTVTRSPLGEDLIAVHTNFQHRELTSYRKTELFQGWFFMIIGGVLSSILGVGSGAVKVLAMDQILKLPYKVSTATSNFMMGITALTSIGVYFANHYIDPYLVSPVVIGIFIGALIGSKVLQFAKSHLLRIIFSIFAVILAFEMLFIGIKNIS